MSAPTDSAVPSSRLATLSPGIRAMAIGAWWFAIMGLLVKLAGRRLPSSQIVLVRATLTLAMSYWAVRQAGLPSIWGRQRGLLLARGALGAIGINCFYYSLVHLPLGDATLIQYTNPIFATVLAALWVGERVRPGELLCLGTALAGVVLITRPGFLFGAAAAAYAQRDVAIALFGAICSGAAYAAVRKLGRTEHRAVVVFYLPLVTFPAAVPFATATWLSPTPVEWLLLIGVAATTQSAQVYMTRGLQAESAVRATTTGYQQIVFAIAWGVLLLGERPSPWMLGGAVISVGSALVLAFGQRPGVVATAIVR
ncbi:MAG: DMT family transporter [Gemmatimonadaceae bacterium]|nr:DMT family transporter [Gemmatimonadaceae bacterium]